MGFEFVHKSTVLGAKTDLGSTSPQHSLPVWHSGSDLTPLSLSFIICKMGILSPALHNCGEASVKSHVKAA